MYLNFFSSFVSTTTRPRTSDPEKNVPPDGGSTRTRNIFTLPLLRRLAAKLPLPRAGNAHGARCLSLPREHLPRPLFIATELCRMLSISSISLLLAPCPTTRPFTFDRRRLACIAPAPRTHAYACAYRDKKIKCAVTSGVLVSQV